MEVKTVLLDDLAVKRALKRISHEIIENNKGVNNVVLIGIARGGIPVCERLAENIKDIEGVQILSANITVSNFRDDVASDKKENSINSDISFSIVDKDVVLCDDVLFTGRTVRAGIEAIISNGRPRTIQLAVLIDRGHRELPIRADYVGKNVPTSRDEIVSVRFDGIKSEAVILKKE